MPSVLHGKQVLLLDMNGTFMFGEDRFSETEDFSIHYLDAGGTLEKEEVNTLVRATFDYLAERYPEASYRETFPSLETAIRCAAGGKIGEEEISKVMETFAYHELGYVPGEYVEALHELASVFRLGAVIDIWSPKNLWLREFNRVGISQLFSAVSFSSDHGTVKPSPKPFEKVLQELGCSPTEALVVGDSVERDLYGANNAGIDCVLVGGAKHSKAIGQFDSLLEFCLTNGQGS